ncbi:MAG: YaiI/YqxD family protein [Pseudomonadota bacterium]
MTIWVDADACPGVVKDILFRAAQRTETPVTLVANRPLAIPGSPWISLRVVAHGFDVADALIVESLAPGDLVITADIPLAAEALGRGAQALSPRGEPFSPETIQAQLTLRDFMDTLRGSGVRTGGPPPLGQADRQRFAQHLDRYLARRPR